MPSPSPAPDWNDRYAAGNTPWDSGRPSEELRRILAEHAVVPCRMLEIGCGTGVNAVHLAQRGFQVTAFDLSPLAVEKARARAAEAGISVDFQVGDALGWRTDQPFDFVFDRGVYHALRGIDLSAFLATLQNVCAPGAFYLSLMGNANDPAPADQGPPRVAAHELLAELGPLFDLVQLREFRFDAVTPSGEPFRPLAWSALLRCKA